MNRSVLFAISLLASLYGIGPAEAQQFEKNSAANIFGPNGPQVPVYSASGAKSETINDREENESESGGDPRLGAKAFLEQMCKQVGPKSSACNELAALEGRQGSGTTRKLGFEPSASQGETASTDDDGLSDE